MPVADNDGVSIRYEIDDGEVDDGKVVVFCGDIGFGPWSFGWQYGALAGPFTVITPEARGIGRSGAPPGPYTVEALAGDLEAVLSDAGVPRAYLIGYGLGGMVALTYAWRFNRADSLTIIGSAATGEAFDPASLRRDSSDRESVRASTTGLLSPSFRADRPEVIERIVDWRLAEDAREGVFAAQRDAVRGFDRADALFEITTPTLVIHGEEDTVCPVEAGKWLASGLPRGRFHSIADAGHLVWVEASAAVNDAIRGWLAEQGADPFA